MLSLYSGNVKEAPMRSAIKTIHLLALTLFIGSIFGHILLAGLVSPNNDLVSFITLIKAKYANVQFLTTPGIITVLISGILLLATRQQKPKIERWIAIKLGLIVLIVINGVFILTPISHGMVTLLNGVILVEQIPAEFYELKEKEDIFGAINLGLIVAVMILSVVKPKLSKAEKSNRVALENAA